MHSEKFVVVVDYSDPNPPMHEWFGSDFRGKCEARHYFKNCPPKNAYMLDGLWAVNFALDGVITGEDQVAVVFGPFSRTEAGEFLRVCESNPNICGVAMCSERQFLSRRRFKIRHVVYSDG